MLSTQKQLEHISALLTACLRLPTGSDITGKVLEEVLAHVHNAKVLGTYDFIDVWHEAGKTGWQVKSTQSSTTVTWIRAKIANKDALIDASWSGPQGVTRLGEAIIEFCNQHVLASVRKYKLQNVNYARLIEDKNGKFTYFEKALPFALPQEHKLFDPADFEWEWSSPKQATKKEQLQALHGRNIHTGTKWFAWHGLGENQLHFTAEATWWPDSNYPYQITFDRPSDNLPFDKLLAMLDRNLL